VTGCVDRIQWRERAWSLARATLAHMALASPARPTGDSLVNRHRLESMEVDVKRLVEERLVEEAFSPKSPKNPQLQHARRYARLADGSEGDAAWAKGRSLASQMLSKLQSLVIHCLKVSAPLLAQVFNCKSVIVPEEGSWKVQWDAFVLVLIMYSAVIVPYRICFGAPAVGLTWAWELLISLCFIVDLSFSFRTAFFQDGVWVKSRKAIALQYFRSWFWIDAPASLPLELLDLLPFDLDSSNAAVPRMLRLFRLFRLLRLLKLLKVGDQIEKLEDMFEVNLRFLQLFVLLLKILFTAHILACIYYALAIAVDNGALGGTPGETKSWLSAWKMQEEDREIPLSEIYALCMYWALMTLTTVGYGDIVGRTHAEVVYVSFSFLVAAMVNATAISQISTLFMSLDHQSVLVQQKLDSVKEYVTSRELPKPLGGRLKRHFKYYYSRRPAFDEVELLSECPPALRADVERFVLQGTLGQLALFSQHLDPEFMSEIFPFIKPVSYAAGDLIFSKGEVSRDLLFLLEGEVCSDAMHL
jgi:hypothetical protein